MEFFSEAYSVRLLAHTDKYLWADPDHKSISQKKGKDTYGVIWRVELVPERGAIRLKSVYDLYLHASDYAFLLGATGKKVTQSFASKADSSLEWVPEQCASYMKLRARSNKYLRANGGVPPYRNSVTHDLPVLQGNQHVIFWTVQVVTKKDAPSLQPIRLTTPIHSDASTSKSSSQHKQREDSSDDDSPQFTPARGSKSRQKSKPTLEIPPSAEPSSSSEPPSPVSSTQTPRGDSSRPRRFTSPARGDDSSRARRRSSLPLENESHSSRGRTSPAREDDSSRARRRSSLPLEKASHSPRRRTSPSRADDGSLPRRRTSPAREDDSSRARRRSSLPLENASHSSRGRTSPAREDDSSRARRRSSLPLENASHSSRGQTSPSREDDSPRPRSHSPLFHGAKNGPLPRKIPSPDDSDTSSPRMRPPTTLKSSRSPPRNDASESSVSRLKPRPTDNLEENESSSRGRTSLNTMESKSTDIRRIFYQHAEDDGEVLALEDGSFGTFMFTGSTVDELTEQLRRETKIDDDIILCLRNPLSAKLYKMRLALPSNKAPLSVVIVRQNSRFGRTLSIQSTR